MVESCQRGLCVNSCLTAFHVVVSLQACNFGAVLRHVVLEACHGCCSLGSNPLQEAARTVIWISLRALRSQCHAINPDLACSRTASGIRVAQTVFSLYFFSQEKKKKTFMPSVQKPAGKSVLLQIQTKYSHSLFPE